MSVQSNTVIKTMRDHPNFFLNVNERKQPFWDQNILELLLFARYHESVITTNTL